MADRYDSYTTVTIPLHDRYVRYTTIGALCATIVPLCFYVLGAFLPSVPGRARDAHHLIKTSPDWPTPLGPWVRAWGAERG